MAKQQVVDTPPEARKKRKVSPIRIELDQGNDQWTTLHEIGSVKAAVLAVKEQIADGQTMRIVRVLGTFRSKLVTKKSLESV